MKKFLKFLFILALCGLAGFAGYELALHQVSAPTIPDYSMYTPVPTAVSGQSVSGSASVASDDTSAGDEDDSDDADVVREISFAACGDNLINSYLYSQARARGKNGAYDFSYCYKSVAKFFKNTDLCWMNQETLVTDTLAPSSYPRFSSPGDVARALYDINFRVFNISTNHTYDQGATGLAETYKFWKAMPDDVLAVGLVKKDVYDKIPIKTVDGVKFAFLSYTYGTNGISTPYDSKRRVIFLSETDIIKKQVKLARKKADIVIVSCHWGNEDRHEITDSQKDLAKKLTGWGADLIIGTHPHVVQDAGWVKSKGRKAFCAYSLGNFISGQSKSDNLIGVVLSLKFEVAEDLLEETYTVTIKEPKLIPTVTEYRNGHSNIRVKWLKDYKRADADTHGVRSVGGKLDYEYIFEVLSENISKKYLDLPEKK